MFWTRVRLPPGPPKEVLMYNLLLLIVIVYCVVHWAWAVATYDWTKFEEDQEQAEKDLF